jgi:rubrerythrin
MREEPIRKRIDLSQSAEKPGRNALHGELLAIEQYEEMALRRRDALRHLEQVNGLG